MSDSSVAGGEHMNDMPSDKLKKIEKRLLLHANLFRFFLVNGVFFSFVAVVVYFNSDFIVAYFIQLYIGSMLAFASVFLWFFLNVSWVWRDEL